MQGFIENIRVGRFTYIFICGSVGKVDNNYLKYIDLGIKRCVSSHCTVHSLVF